MKEMGLSMLSECGLMIFFINIALIRLCLFNGGGTRVLNVNTSPFKHWMICCDRTLNPFGKLFTIPLPCWSTSIQLWTSPQNSPRIIWSCGVRSEMIIMLNNGHRIALARKGTFTHSRNMIFTGIHTLTPPVLAFPFLKYFCFICDAHCSSTCSRLGSHNASDW